MSHAYGEVIHNNQVIGHFEYNGTSDFAHNRIFGSSEEVRKWWRSEYSNNATCVCGQPPTDVILYSHYGNGFHWAAKACLTCKAITYGDRPWREEYHTVNGVEKEVYFDATKGYPPNVICKGEPNL